MKRAREQRHASRSALPEGSLLALAAELDELLREGSNLLEVDDHATLSAAAESRLQAIVERAEQVKHLIAAELSRGAHRNETLKWIWKLLSSADIKLLAFDQLLKGQQRTAGARRRH